MARTDNRIIRLDDNHLVQNVCTTTKAKEKAMLQVAKECVCYNYNTKPKTETETMITFTNGMRLFLDDMPHITDKVSLYRYFACSHELYEEYINEGKDGYLQ